MVKEKPLKSKTGNVTSSDEDLKDFLRDTLLNFGECELSGSVRNAISANSDSSEDVFTWSLEILKASTTDVRCECMRLKQFLDSLLYQFNECAYSHEISGVINSLILLLQCVDDYIGEFEQARSGLSSIS